MGLTQLTQETIERDFCPRCKWYIDKRFIYKDYDTGTTLTMGTVKDCKFHTDTNWICDFKEKVENGNDD
jgi:hypothetical protein